MTTLKTLKNGRRGSMTKCHVQKKAFKSGEKVLLYNLRRADRKGGKQVDRWDGPYTVVEVFNNGNYSLRNESGQLY